MSQLIKLPWVQRESDTPIWLKIAYLVLMWRIALGVVGVIASRILPYQPSFPYSENLLQRPMAPSIAKWGGFDGVHYLTIIDRGYAGTGLIQAFFPIFPVTVKLAAKFVEPVDPVLVGLTLNLFLTWLAAVIAWYLLRRDVSEQQAWFGILALLLFPTSLFFGALYSEALFLCLSLWALLAMRQQRWWLSAGLIAIASATRITGIFLLIPLAWEWASARHWHGHKLAKQSPQLVALLAIGTLGLLGYMLYLWRFFGDPLYFLHVQAEFGAGRSETIIIYPQVVWRYLKMLITVKPHDWKFFSICLEFLAGTLPMLALLKWWRLVRPSYLLYGLACFLLPTVTGTFSSMPRYLLVVWPIFLGLAIWSKKHTPSFILYLIFSTVLLIINTVLFIQGYWVA